MLCESINTLCLIATTHLGHTRGIIILSRQQCIRGTTALGGNTQCGSRGPVNDKHGAKALDYGATLSITAIYSIMCRVENRRYILCSDTAVHDT